MKTARRDADGEKLFSFEKSIFCDADTLFLMVERVLDEYPDD